MWEHPWTLLSTLFANLALALCNAQGELHPLEEGLHALGSGMEPKRPIHQTSFDLADIRTVEPSDPGSTIRHGLDGSGRFEPSRTSTQSPA
jgi:hypothetical protein